MNWNRALMSTLFIGVPVVGLLAYGMTRDPREIRSPLPGREAPTFTHAVFAPGNDSVLKLPIGDTVNLAALRGKIVVVNFWASWCLACRDEHQDLSQVARIYGQRGVKFYGLLYNDAEANGTRWISDMGGQAYPALSDPGARSAISYGLYGVPETFVVNQQGIVAHKYTGAVHADQLAALLDSLLTAGAADGATPSKDVPVASPVSGASKLP